VNGVAIILELKIKSEKLKTNNNFQALSNFII